ncbi:ABC transporter ATP-binding protein [Spirosoma flavus]
MKSKETNETVISIKGLRKSFGDLHVLRGVNLEVNRGENVVVLGRSGTGKSVLIKIMVGLLKPDAGKVIVLGHDVEQLRGKELDEFRQKVGFSFQSSALYDSMSIRENLEFPLVRNIRNLSRAEINKAVEKALSDVGLSQTINQMPAELSGGQRKRIGIARTLILKPEIMLYDEPTAGLDPITSVEINNLINDVRERLGATSIIITHDLTCAKTTGDRIAMLLDGKFERVGTFEEVFKDPEERIQQFYNYNFVDER